MHMALSPASYTEKMASSVTRTEQHLCATSATPNPNADSVRNTTRLKKNYRGRKWHTFTTVNAIRCHYPDPTHPQQVHLLIGSNFGRRRGQLVLSVPLGHEYMLLRSKREKEGEGR